LATYSIKFYIIGYVSSCCVQLAFDCRVLKSVDGIIDLEVRHSFVLISGQLCAAQWSVTPCLPTNPLSPTPQAKVVCRMSTVDRMRMYTRASHPYRRPSAGTTDYETVCGFPLIPGSGRYVG